MSDLEFGRFKAGNERVLTSYFDKHVKALLVYAFRIVADDQWSEELVQDAYVKLWSNRERIESESHLRSFLYKAVLRSGIDLLRKNGRQSFTDIEELDDSLVDLKESPLVNIIQLETLQLIYAEVRKLPKSQQQVFKLAFLEGMSTDEISKELGINNNAVFVAKSKALSHLKQIFRDKTVLLIISALLFRNDLLN